MIEEVKLRKIMRLPNRMVFHMNVLINDFTIQVGV
jgi:hypothetical protein